MFMSGQSPPMLWDFYIERIYVNSSLAIKRRTRKWLKLRLHFNELAQRTATVWRYLTFGDIRCYTLKKSDECDH